MQDRKETRTTVGMTKMIDSISSIRVQAHRANIERYRKLMAGKLTLVEREYIMRRIAEERAEMKRLEAPSDNWAAPPSLGTNPLSEREPYAAALRWEQRL